MNNEDRVKAMIEAMNKRALQINTNGVAAVAIQTAIMPGPSNYRVEIRFLGGDVYHATHLMLALANEMSNAPQTVPKFDAVCSRVTDNFLNQIILVAFSGGNAVLNQSVVDSAFNAVGIPV